MSIRFLIIAISIICLSAVFLASPDEERAIIGTWKESHWKYEKIDDKILIDTDLKQIIRHEFESWVFMPNGILRMFKNGKVTKEAVWKVKGRGHILKLSYPDGEEELYDIKELNRNEFVVNFDIGMETRGIARLTFTRVHPNRNKR